MRLFLIGATGRTGNWILKSALAHGHEVMALVREHAGQPISARLDVSHPNLKLIAGDLLNFPNLDQLLRGQDALLSALNSPVVEEGTRRVIAASQLAGVTRFMGVAGGGILQLDDQRLRRERPGYPEVFLKSSHGHFNAWKALEASMLEWTLVCTPDLLDAPATGRARALADFMPEGLRSVSCGDVAEFMMGELVARRFSRKRVGFTERRE